MVLELDKQKQMKEEKIKKQKEEDAQYDIYLKEHCKMLDKKEAEKKQKIAEKIAKEKEMRDVQLKKKEHK